MAAKVRQFLEEDWFAWFGCVQLITVDSVVEFCGGLRKLVELCSSKFGKVTEYYPEGAGMIERGH